MATENFDSSVQSVNRYEHDNVYATVHAFTTATYSEGPNMHVGQIYSDSPPYYSIYRLFLHFDTSTLPDTALIKSASIRFNFSTNLGNKTYSIRNGQPTYPHHPVVDGDFDFSHYSGNGGSVIASGTGNHYIYLNSTGLSWINKTGYTKFIFLSDNDINSVPPTGSEYIVTARTTIRLTVEYYLPTGSPAVTYVQPCQDIQSTTMSAVGNVTNDGGGYEERGFEYYESAAGYEAEMYAVRELGTFNGTGQFKMTINQLKPETEYLIRSWVRNVYATVYSAWYTCTTAAVPAIDYGIYEEQNSLPDSDGIYANNNTICFYVRKVGGKWSKKYGPYNKDQSNIEITNALIEGTGKYQIKFESGVLTGISAGVMCKVDIKAR